MTAGCRGKSGVQGPQAPAGVWGSAPKPVPQHNLASVASGQRPQETRLIPPASFSPSAPTTRFAALANIGVLRAGHAQPLYLLTPSGRFAAFGGKCPPGTRFLSAHLRVALRCAQQPTGLTLPCLHAASGFARSIVAEGAGRAHRSFRGPPSGRFALRATAHRAGASLRCPKTCAAAQPRKRCERPKAARNAAHSTRIVFPIRGRRGIIPPAAHLFAPLRQGLPSCAPKPAIKPYQQRSQSP